jgi:predicted metal-binding membrane protein
MQLRAGVDRVLLRPAPPSQGWGTVLAIEAGVLLAWVVLAVTFVASAGGSETSMAGMPGMADMAGMAAVRGGAHPGSTFLETSAIATWSLMVVAMMLPATVPAIRHVAVNSLRRRRRRAIALFVAVYLTVWVAFGALVLVLASLWSGAGGAAVPALALGVAAAWQLTGRKRRALLDCHRTSPLPPRGWRASAAVLRFASINALACVRSCWAMMLAMGASRSLTLLWMVAITGIVTTEKLAERPRQPARAGAIVLAAGAVLVAVA